MHLISSREKRCPRVRAEFPSWFGASEAAWAEGGEKAKLDGGEQDFGNPKGKSRLQDVITCWRQRDRFGYFQHLALPVISSRGGILVLAAEALSQLRKLWGLESCPVDPALVYCIVSGLG
jgi:hypothetical protein